MKKLWLLGLLVGLGNTWATAADTFTIDSAYAPAHFDIARVGFSAQRGRFDKTQGVVTLDLARRLGSVDFTVFTQSINMGSAAWTAHLSDEGLFNVAKYPTMHYRSERFIFDGDKVVAADGQFTMLGVTKPLRVIVQNFQCGPNPVDQRYMCSGNITATLKRSDFGLTKYIPVVSDEVSINVPLDAYKN